MSEPPETLPIASAGIHRPVSPLSISPPPDAKKRRLPTWRSAGRLITEPAAQAWRDLRTARWASFGRCVMWFFLILSTVVLLVLLLIFALGYQSPFASANSPFSSDPGCQPDGSFSVVVNSFDWWAPKGFFEITVSFPGFNFTTAKVLDIAWQVIVGRGGQALIALSSWRVFADYIATKITLSPVTYTTFWVMFLYQEPTLTSSYQLVREFSLHKTVGSRIASTFMIFTVIFALAFPTFMNSMTGYITDNGPYVQVLEPEGNMVPFSDFKKVAYVVHDGHRINLTDDYNVIFNTWSPLDPGTNCVRGFGDTMDCAILGAVSKYVEDYGFFALRNEETTWMDRSSFPEDSKVGKGEYPELSEISLPAPALNISGFSFLNYDEVYGYDWPDPRSGQHPFRNGSKQMYVYSDDRYSMDYVKKHGRCQPLSTEKYRWGFSFIQLFIMMIVLFIWSTGICMMWFKNRRHLPLQDEPEVPRGWRAVQELSRAMDRELPPEGIDVTKTTDRETKRKIRKRLRGGTISLDGTLARPEYRTWPAFLSWAWRWAQREKWWIVALLSVLGVSFATWYCIQSVAPPILLWILACVIPFVIWLGSTVQSRVFMLVVVCLVLVVCVIPSVIVPEIAYDRWIEELTHGTKDR